jgi:hypothetical protein
MEMKIIRVMGPPPEPGTHYFDYDRFVSASGVAEQQLRDLITGFRNWEPCSPYIINMFLHDAAEVEHGIPGSFEEIVKFSPHTPVTSYQLYAREPQRAIVAHEVLWQEHRSLIDRVRLHRHLLEPRRRSRKSAPAEQVTVNPAKRTFDKAALKKLYRARMVDCLPVDPNKWREFRSAIVNDPPPDERAFEVLFMQVSVERARVMREYDPRIMLGTGFAPAEAEREKDAPLQSPQPPVRRRERNDEPSDAESERGSKVLSGMATRRPSKEAFRNEYRQAGFKGSNKKLNSIFDAVKSQR